MIGWHLNSETRLKVTEDNIKERKKLGNSAKPRAINAFFASRPRFSFLLHSCNFFLFRFCCLFCFIFRGWCFHSAKRNEKKTRFFPFFFAEKASRPCAALWGSGYGRLRPSADRTPPSRRWCSSLLSVSPLSSVRLSDFPACSPLVRFCRENLNLSRVSSRVVLCSRVSLVGNEPKIGYRWHRIGRIIARSRWSHPLNRSFSSQTYVSFVFRCFPTPFYLDTVESWSLMGNWFLIRFCWILFGFSWP